tara:strand:- start:15238 stop:15894 length:657 start_codon:yes stop_codon:yes gene_type:complete
MELTKQQIQHIENRLIKNGVKYWDIRIEMLDHIVSDVEKRMELGENFEDAIQNSFISLGWKGSFESLIQKRQKQYSKFYNKEINLGFKSFFTSFKSLLSYAILMLLLYFSLEVKIVTKSILISLIVLFLALVAYNLFNYKKIFKSASLLASFTFLTMTLSFLNCFLFFPKVFLDVQEQSNIYLSIVILILYPMFYVGYQTFFKKYQKINSIYLKLIKP